MQMEQSLEALTPSELTVEYQILRERSQSNELWYCSYGCSVEPIDAAADDANQPLQGESTSTAITKLNGVL
jgi:hypothetical protein